MSEAPITDIESWLQALMHPAAVTELVALAASALLAWLLAWLLGRRTIQVDRQSILFGERIIDGVLFPILLLCLSLTARAIVAHWVPLTVFKIAIPVLLSLLVIRLGVKLLQATLRETPLVRALERSISWVAWIVMVLWVSGLLPLVLEELDQITWMVGDSRLSVRTLIEGSLTAGLVLIVALWIASAIETRLLRSATGGELSLRMAVSNATRALLLFVGLLIALAAVGIDLTA